MYIHLEVTVFSQRSLGIQKNEQKKINTLLLTLKSFFFFKLKASLIRLSFKLQDPRRLNLLFSLNFTNTFFKSNIWLHLVLSSGLACFLEWLKPSIWTSWTPSISRTTWQHCKKVTKWEKRTNTCTLNYCSKN